MVIVNLLKTTGIYFFSVLLIFSSALLAMETKNLGKIPVPAGNLGGIVASGPSNLLIYGVKGKGSYVEKHDFSGQLLNNHVIEGFGLKAMFELPGSDEEVMIFSSNTDTLEEAVEKLNVNTWQLCKIFDIEKEDKDMELDWSSMLNYNRVVFHDMNSPFQVYDYETGTRLKEFKFPFSALHEVTDGDNRIFRLMGQEKADSRDLLKIWDIEKGEYIDAIEIPSRPREDNRYPYEIINKICYLNSDYIALAWLDGVLSIWNLKTPEKVWEGHAHDCAIFSILDIGKGYFVTAGIEDGLVKTWHVSKSTCQHVFAGHKEDNDLSITVLAKLPGGLIASGTKVSVMISRALVGGDI